MNRSIPAPPPTDLTDAAERLGANAAELEPNPDDVPPNARRIPWPLKVIGVIGILLGGGVSALFILTVVGIALVVADGQSSVLAAATDMSTASLVISIVEAVLHAALAAMFVVFGVRLLLDKRRHAAQLAEAMAFVVVGVGVCDTMLSGMSLRLIPYLIDLGFLVFVTGYLDPSLAEERELQRRLRDMETREAAEKGTLGLDETGRGYITLNFFNLFWIFVVCSVLGLAIEVVYHIVVVDPGHYEDRAGLLFGPFSPIYGVGAVLMTMALNRFHKAPLIVVFLVSAVIGGAFEFAVSWFMQFAFGIVAWDYTGTFLSIDGRTNGMFMAMWGALGLAWVKLLLPSMLKVVNLIPWNWRYTVTTVCAALMLVDCAMTLVSLDRWYQRMAGNTPDNAVGAFFDEHFDNAYMDHRFQSMSIDPSNATRTN